MQRGEGGRIGCTLNSRVLYSYWGNACSVGHCIEGYAAALCTLSHLGSARAVDAQVVVAEAVGAEYATCYLGWMSDRMGNEQV